MNASTFIGGIAGSLLALATGLGCVVTDHGPGGGVGARDLECVAGEPCECDGLGSCDAVCLDGGCDFTCAGQGACDFECPAGGCDAVCEGQGSCDMDCSGGGCSLTCAGLGSCDLLCQGECELDCRGAGACNQSEPG